MRKMPRSIIASTISGVTSRPRSIASPAAAEHRPQFARAIEIGLRQLCRRCAPQSHPSPSLGRRRPPALCRHYDAMGNADPLLPGMHPSDLS